LAAVAGAGAVLLAAIALAAHHPLGRAAGWPFAAKAAITAAAILPLGVCLGTFFPAGIRTVLEADDRLVPWAVGLNAIASVLGSVAAMAIAIATGFRQALCVGLLSYAVALLAFCALTKSTRGQEAGKEVGHPAEGPRRSP
jgi:hypothetical protein